MFWETTTYNYVGTLNHEIDHNNGSYLGFPSPLNEPTHNYARGFQADGRKGDSKESSKSVPDPEGGLGFRGLGFWDWGFRAFGACSLRSTVDRLRVQDLRFKGLFRHSYGSGFTGRQVLGFRVVAQVLGFRVVAIEFRVCTRWIMRCMWGIVKIMVPKWGKFI